MTKTVVSINVVLFAIYLLTHSVVMVNYNNLFRALMTRHQQTTSQQHQQQWLPSACLCVTFMWQPVMPSHVGVGWGGKASSVCRCSADGAAASWKNGRIVTPKTALSGAAHHETAARRRRSASDCSLNGPIFPWTSCWIWRRSGV